MSDEAGHYSRISSLQNGYWLWLSGVAVLSLTIMIDRFTNTSRKIIQQNADDATHC
jgi:hypothetical protein